MITYTLAMPSSADASTPVVRPVALMNQKGGVGKTTTAVNLGAAFADAGRRVCLIDLDPQANLTLHLGIDPGQAPSTVYDLLLDPACEARQTVITVRANLDVIPAEVDLAAAETELAARPDRQRILLEKFAPLRDEYELVLIDCPPSLGLLTLNALSLAEEVFVPMQAHFLALQGVGKLLETVARVCQSVNRGLRVTGIVLCMHESQTTLAKEVVADLDQFFARVGDQDLPWRSCRVLRPAIRRNIKLAEAPSFGQTIFEYSPWCRGALDYRKLAHGLLAGADEPPGPPAHSEEAPPRSRGPTVEPKPQAPPGAVSVSAGVSAHQSASAPGPEPPPSPTTDDC